MKMMMRKKGGATKREESEGELTGIETRNRKDLVTELIELRELDTTVTI